MKKTVTDYCKEWLDTLVVAISVAMAFRAYFYEPFKIPTGSMQETLWGYHTSAGVEKGAGDVFPLSVLKWAWTGSRVVDWKAPVTGQIRCIPRNDGKSTLCTLTEFRLERVNDWTCMFHIRGNRFLHRQVRAMVGTLFDVGRGRFPNGTVDAIFSKQFEGERTWAPPQGLVLQDVEYADNYCAIYAKNRPVRSVCFYLVCKNLKELRGG